MPCHTAPEPLTQLKCPERKEKSANPFDGTPPETRVNEVAAPLTPEEFAEKMRILSELDDRDPEAAHSDGDDLLCDTLKKLGYAEGVELFEKMDKWYA